MCICGVSKMQCNRRLCRRIFALNTTLPHYTSIITSSILLNLREQTYNNKNIHDRDSLYGCTATGKQSLAWKFIFSAQHTSFILCKRHSTFSGSSSSALFSSCEWTHTSTATLELQLFFTVTRCCVVLQTTVHREYNRRAEQVRRYRRTVTGTHKHRGTETEVHTSNKMRCSAETQT